MLFQATVHGDNEMFGLGDTQNIPVILHYVSMILRLWCVLLVI